MPSTFSTPVSTEKWNQLVKLGYIDLDFINEFSIPSNQLRVIANFIYTKNSIPVCDFLDWLDSVHPDWDFDQLLTAIKAN